jgi:hypothetical protein
MGAMVVGGFPMVEFDRAPLDSYFLRGFTLGWSKELTLVHVVDNVYFQLNGYAVFRNSDVKRWRPILPDLFFAKAAKINRLRPRVSVGMRSGR